MLHLSSLVGDLSAYEAQTLQLEDPRPHPPEAALSQLGLGLMNEVLDLTSNTALEDFQTIVCEALIGAFHSASQRIEREADRARDTLNGLVRTFDGSEVVDTEIQDATRKVVAADVAAMALDMVRDAAASGYTAATGDVWTPWKGSVRASRTTAAQVEARDVIRQREDRKHRATDPGALVVAFRASPIANGHEDANRIFDALNWALERCPPCATSAE